MKSTTTLFFYGQDQLTAKIALKLCSGELKGKLSDETREKVSASHRVVAQIVAKKEPVYGINTGIGSLCTTMISEEKTRLLQQNILKSHSVGVGEAVHLDIAKLMLVLKVHALAKAYSGVAVETLERMIWHIDYNVIPVVPGQGSVGASGDLAPLSHLFLSLIGLGEVIYRDERIPSGLMLQKEGMEAIALGPKEALALINGTQFIAAFAIKVVERLHNCLSHADLIGAMMIEGLLGSTKPFVPELHQLRPFRGTQHVAARIAALLHDSEIVASHANCGRVQDPYSLRCMPQVHGASRNAWLHLKEILEIELNAVTDNPIIFSPEHTISGGNFHGQPLALPLDYACLAAAEIGNISDRRIYLSLEGKTNGVPQLLMNDTGINSGFMIPQYTTAALVSENKGLCFPASADSIPTSLGQEDHVSMGSIGARKALRVIDNVEKILGIELLCAAQAFDFHKHLKSGPILTAIHQYIRQNIAFADKDEVLAINMEKAIALVRSGKIIQLADQVSESGMISIRTEFDYLFEAY